MELVIHEVNKKYSNQKVALRNFSLHLQPGVYGLLGPNGAGKSTLMKIIATLSQPSSGSVSWCGTDISRSPNELRKVLGYLPQDFGVYPNLHAVEFLEYMSVIKGIPRKEARNRIEQLLVHLNLVDAGKRPLGGYSGGMKQRVGIAQALLNDPKLLIIDEPTVGLDPEERIRFRNLLSSLSKDRIILLSTHIVSDVEAIATKIAIMDQGSLCAFQQPEELIRKTEGKVWHVIIPNHDELVALQQQYTVSHVNLRSNGYHVRVISDQSPHESATPTLTSLEDAYLYYVSSQRERVV